MWIYWIYFLLVVLSAPAVLWTSFEAYFLTLFFGSQMLFFSVIHSMPMLGFLIIVTLPFSPILALFNIVMITSKLRFSGHSDLSKIALYIVLFQFLHVMALFSYDVWSHVFIIQKLISIFGFFVPVFLVFLPIIKLHRELFSAY